MFGLSFSISLSLPASTVSYSPCLFSLTHDRTSCMLVEIGKACLEASCGYVDIYIYIYVCVCIYSNYSKKTIYIYIYKINTYSYTFVYIFFLYLCVCVCVCGEGTGHVRSSNFGAGAANASGNKKRITRPSGEGVAEPKEVKSTCSTGSC